MNLRDWRDQAKTGDRVTYHTGNLQVDRVRNPDLGAVADAARRLHEAGSVALVQRRVSEGVVDYVAVATKRTAAREPS